MWSAKRVAESRKIIFRFPYGQKVENKKGEVLSLTATTYLQRSQNPVMVLGVLPNPGVAVVNVRRVKILISYFRQNNEPLLEIFRSKSIVRTSVSEVYNQLEGLVAERLQC
jgi:hypothetical protein